MDGSTWLAIGERLGVAVVFGYAFYKLLWRAQDRMFTIMEQDRKGQSEALDNLTRVVGELRDLMMEIKGFLGINGHKERH